MAKKKKYSTEPSDVLNLADDFETKSKQKVPKDEWGNVGVRATLTNAGLKNEKIGYDGEYVTYGGERLIMPEYESGGTSYAKQSDINSAINRAYKSEGIEVAPIAQLAASYGVPQYAAKFENGSVYLGGREVPAFYTADGIAYGDADKVSEASEWYRNATGAKSFSDILSDYTRGESKVDRMLNAYLTRDDWSYDPESDPAYIAYAKAAQREGAKAYEDILGNMIARTGGNMNSAASVAASAGYNNYLSSIQDKIPEFAEASYDRYAEDRKMDLNDIRAAEDIYRNRFEDSLSLTESANDFNRQNGIDEFLRKNDEQSLKQNIIYTDLYDEIMNGEITSQNIENTISEAEAKYAEDRAYQAYLSDKENTRLAGAKADAVNAENIYRDAVVRGYFLPGEASYLGISPSLDPVESYRRFLILEKVK